MTNIQAAQQGIIEIPNAFAVISSDGDMFYTTCPNSSGWFDNRHIAVLDNMDDSDIFCAEFNEGF